MMVIITLVYLYLSLHTYIHHHKHTVHVRDWNSGLIKKYHMHCLFSCWIRHTLLCVNTPSSLSVHSASALRSPASLTLGNLSAVLFPLTGGTTTSFPALALCSARWANTHITQMHARESAHTQLCLYTTTSCQSCFPTRSAPGPGGLEERER